MINAIFQGIIQGITEFLPVSSSGHIALFQYFSGLEDIEGNLLTNIAVHFGTLLAVIFYFKNDITPYFTASGWRDPLRRKIALLVIAGSVPTAIIGVFFKDFFKGLFANPTAICVALFATGLILLLAEKLKSTQSQEDISDFSLSKGFLVGLAQGIAITPGISRSGSTISAGLLLGLKGEDCARLSFLMMIPAVAGATLLEARPLLKSGLPESLNAVSLLVSVAVAIITGFLSLKLLVYLVKKQKLSIFSYYLFAVSIICFILINFAGM